MCFLTKLCYVLLDKIIITEKDLYQSQHIGVASGAVVSDHLTIWPNSSRSVGAIIVPMVVETFQLHAL